MSSTTSASLSIRSPAVSTLPEKSTATDACRSQRDIRPGFRRAVEHAATRKILDGVTGHLELQEGQVDTHGPHVVDDPVGDLDRIPDGVLFHVRIRRASVQIGRGLLLYILR